MLYTSQRIQQLDPNPSRQPPTMQYSSRDVPSARQATSKNGRADTTTLQASHGISRKLISLVSKFESLDATSLPFTIPALQPAPLHILWGGSRRRAATNGSPQNKLSTTSIPKRGGMEQDETRCSEETITPNSPKWKTLNSAPKISAKKSIPESKTSGSAKKSTRLHGDANGPPEDFQPKGIGTITAPYVENECFAKQEVDSIQDKIKLYDGSMSASTTRARPSICPPPQCTTPISKIRLHNSANRSRESTLSSRRRLMTLRALGPKTPTKTKNRPRQRNLKSGSTAPSPFLPSSSPTQFATSDASPLATDGYKPCWKPAALVSESGPRLSTEERNVESSSKIRVPSKERQNTVIEKEERRGECRPIHKMGIPSDVDQNRVSNYKNDFHCVNGPEKRYKLSIEVDQAVPPTFSITSQKHLDQTIPFIRTNHSERRESKVAYMKRLFENERFKGSVRRTYISARKSTVLEPESNALKRAQLPPSTPIPRAVPQSIPPKTIPEPVVPCKLDKSRLHSMSPVKKAPQPKSKLIGDKVKQFESSFERVALQPRRISIARKVNRSLKGLFEPRKTIDEGKYGKKIRLKAMEVEEIINELQENEWEGKVDKKSVLMGSWNNNPQSLTDGATSDKTASPPDVEEAEVLVVKEVECGLKHPKPLRVVEMRRMMLLCREKVGNINKERVTRARNS